MISAVLAVLVAASPAKAAAPPVYSVPYCGPGPGASVDANNIWWGKMLKARAAMTTQLGRQFCNRSRGNLFADNMWASRQYVCPQSLIVDRFLYDRETHSWTVGRFLDDLRVRYGGVDSVMLWQRLVEPPRAEGDRYLVGKHNPETPPARTPTTPASYTNLGVDERNQMDELRAVPGGIAALTGVIRQFHASGVTVLFPWNHWGNSTGHIEPDADFVELLAELGADGFNTDSGGRPLVYGEEGYRPDPDQYENHGFDGTSFVDQGLKQRLKFNGHDFLDQPEHGAGCPPDLILGGWSGEGGGPGPGACVECAKLVEPRHLTQVRGPRAPRG